MEINAASRIFEEYTKVVLLSNDLTHESEDIDLQRKRDRDDKYAKEELLGVALSDAKVVALPC